jgi:hypothetical protein
MWNLIYVATLVANTHEPDALYTAQSIQAFFQIGQLLPGIGAERLLLAMTAQGFMQRSP